MTPAVLMIVGAVAAVLGLITVVANFIGFAGKVHDPFSVRPGKFMAAHLIGALVAALGSMSLVAGFCWFLVERAVQ